MLKSVTQWLDVTAERLPDKIAFGEDRAGTLTFGELRDCSRRIGSYLAKAGFFKRPVMIAMDKTPQCVAAMLGCAYANCPYVPVDVDNPAERIAKIIANLDPAVCVTTEKYRRKLLDSSAENVILYGDAVITEVDDHLLDDIHRLRISTDMLYIIFTSGSTGTPKGVAVSHGNIFDYALTLSETFGFGEETVFGQSVPFFFDSSILYIYQTVKNGCTDWILSKTQLMFPAKTVDFLNEHQCDTIYWVPTSYNILAKSGIFGAKIPEYLRNCFFVGEVMPNSVLNVWRRVLPGARFVNLFGPTEITGTFVYYAVDREFADDEPLPIGKRYDNCDVFLLNEDGGLTNPGETGELCVRGAKISGGYWNAPEKTAEVFIQNPLNPYYREFIYKTGDLAYLNERGEYMYAGRRDFQIKHAGHRIELGEIEAAAGLVAGVDLCACVFDAQANVIVMFFSGDADEKSIRDGLRGKLQDYMIPDRFVKLDRMPRTGSGKISRADLKGLL
jgi:amino acid adenylation domain-containing protein